MGQTSEQGGGWIFECINVITQRTASDTAPSGQACGGIASGLVDGAGGYSAVMNNPRVDSHNVKANVERLCMPELQGGALGLMGRAQQEGQTHVDSSPLPH